MASGRWKQAADTRVLSGDTAIPRQPRVSFGSALLPLTACPWRNRQPEEDEQGLVEPQDILVIEPADPRAELGFRHRRDLVDHQPPGRAQTVSFVRLDSKPKQWRVGLVGSEGADS